MSAGTDIFEMILTDQPHPLDASATRMRHEYIPSVNGHTIVVVTGPVVVCTDPLGPCVVPPPTATRMARVVWHRTVQSETHLLLVERQLWTLLGQFQCYLC